MKNKTKRMKPAATSDMFISRSYPGVPEIDLSEDDIGRIHDAVRASKAPSEKGIDIAELVESLPKRVNIVTIKIATRGDRHLTQDEVVALVSSCVNWGEHNQVMTGWPDGARMYVEQEELFDDSKPRKNSHG